MKIAELHSWDLDYQHAVALQRELAGRLIEQTVETGAIKTVCGVDVSSSRRSPIIHAAAVSLEAGSFRVLECATSTVEVDFPYIPGMLSFREGPAVVAAMRKLRNIPDVVIFDGQGYAHPRRLGLAAHLGLWLDLPTVGCAKTRLVGEHEPPHDDKGEWTPLRDGREIIGAVLRTRRDVKPVFISRGHLCDLESAVAIIMATIGKYRLPEPIRLAHALCNEVRRNAGG